MSKCIVCKTSNMALEVKRHPNQQNIALLDILLDRLKKRDPDDIQRVCEDHRNPLRLVVELSNAGHVLDIAKDDPRKFLLVTSH